MFTKNSPLFHFEHLDLSDIVENGGGGGGVGGDRSFCLVLTS